MKGLDELADLLHRSHLEQPRAKECLDVAAATPDAALAMGVRALVNVPRARVRQLSSRTKLLILDVNGFLLERVRGPAPPGVTRRPDASHGGVKVYQRPNMSPFLEWCLEHFHVAIWSTAKKANVDRLAEFALGTDWQRKAAFVWNGTQCTETGFRHPVNRHKPVVLKELTRVWEDPALGAVFNSTNTLLIDDSPYKAAMNPAHTCLHPPAWTCKAEDDETLLPGQPLMAFLHGLAHADDVPSYVAQHDPFRAQAVSEVEANLIQMIRAQRGTGRVADAQGSEGEGGEELVGKAVEVDGLTEQMRRMGLVRGRGAGRGGRGRGRARGAGREFERHSGTARGGKADGRAVKKGGHGKGNWGVTGVDDHGAA